MDGSDDSDNSDQITLFHSDKLATELHSKMSQMQEEDSLCDVTFCVEGETIKAHKAILVAACPFFESMFSSQLCKDTDPIPITEIPKLHFKAILKFIYTADIHLDSENAEELFKLADMLCFEVLKEMISSYFRQQLQPHNALGIYSMAENYHAEVLEKAAWKYCLDNFNLVSLECEFRELNLENLKKYVGDIALKTSSEEYICEKALKWLEFNVEERSSHFHLVLQAIQIQNLSPHYIKFIALNNSSITNNKDSVNILQQALDYHSFQIPLPEERITIFPRTRLNFVSGVALLYPSVYNIQCYMFAFSSNDKFELKKKANIARPGANVACHIHNVWSNNYNIFLTENEQQSLNLCIIDYRRNSYISCIQPRSSLQTILTAEGQQIYGLSINTEKCRILKYRLERNIWERYGTYNVTFNMTEGFVLTDKQFIYLFGSGEDRNGIYQINTRTKTGREMDATLPEEISSMQAVTFCDHIILMDAEVILKTTFTELQTANGSDIFSKKQNTIEGNEFKVVILGNQMLVFCSSDIFSTNIANVIGEADTVMYRNVGNTGTDCSFAVCKVDNIANK